MNPTARKRGRRPIPGEPGRRSKLGLLVRAEVKDLLDGAARQNGTTQAIEAERRIENSFRDQDLLISALEFAYGSKNASLLLIIGEIMADASRRERALDKPDWLVDEAEFRAVFRAIYGVLDKAYPGAEALPLDFTGIADDYFTTWAVLALAVVQKARGEPVPPWASKAIELAGPELIEKLTKELAGLRLAQPRSDA
jgi:hypothetical protein